VQGARTSAIARDLDLRPRGTPTSATRSEHETTGNSSDPKWFWPDADVASPIMDQARNATQDVRHGQVTRLEARRPFAVWPVRPSIHPVHSSPLSRTPGPDYLHDGSHDFAARLGRWGLHLRTNRR
jgi:hypothetical protein